MDNRSQEVSITPGQIILTAEGQGMVVSLGNNEVVIQYDHSPEPVKQSLNEIQILEVRENEDFVDYMRGKFEAYFGSQGGFVSVVPEFMGDDDGPTPTGAYHVYCLHPDHGSCLFLIYPGDYGVWVTDYAPHFIKLDFLEWVGSLIELHK